MAKIKLPFELQRPDQNTPVANASEIDATINNVTKKLDALLTELNTALGNKVNTIILPEVGAKYVLTSTGWEAADVLKLIETQTWTDDKVLLIGDTDDENTISIVRARDEIRLVPESGKVVIEPNHGAAKLEMYKADGSTLEVLAAITQIQTDLSGKVADAPSDSKQYARENGAWVEVEGGGGDASEISYTPASGAETDVETAMRKKVESTPFDTELQSVSASALQNISTLRTDVNALQTAMANLGRAIEFQADVTSMSDFLSAISANTIKPMKVGYAYRVIAEGTLDATHSVKGSAEALEVNDMMVCVIATARMADTELLGYTTKWLVVQANISAEVIQSQIETALQGITSSFEYFAENIWTGSGTPTQADYISWVKQPALDAAAACQIAAQSTGKWVECTRAQYNAWTAAGTIQKGVKYIITDTDGVQGELQTAINALFVHLTRAEYVALSVKNPNAYYFITEETTE